MKRSNCNWKKINKLTAVGNFCSEKPACDTSQRHADTNTHFLQKLLKSNKIKFILIHKKKHAIDHTHTHTPAADLVFSDQELCSHGNSDAGFPSIFLHIVSCTHILKKTKNNNIVLNSSMQNYNACHFQIFQLVTFKAITSASFSE